MYRYALKGQEQFQRTMPFVGTLALSGQTILICQIAKLIRALLSIFQTLKNIDVSLRPERAGAIRQGGALSSQNIRTLALKGRKHKGQRKRSFSAASVTQQVADRFCHLFNGRD